MIIWHCLLMLHINYIGNLNLTSCNIKRLKLVKTVRFSFLSFTVRSWNLELYPFLERLGSSLRLKCLEPPRFPLRWRPKHQFGQLCRSVLKTRNSSNTPWLPEIVTPGPFVWWGCVNTRWKGVNVFYNFCVECFFWICIIWGQRSV
jgi:hypothetical protein